MTHWDYILLGVLTLGVVLMKFKKTKALGTAIGLIMPVFIFFYFIIEGRFEVVFYVLIFLGVYTLIPYAVVKNQKEESK
ncbi:gp089 [Rhodococcus phage ReqiPoco6]|uniref:Gp089 n=1 Tax=Rhodococcus phage ReqiPoco6 TaxID=691964 RepID=D4P7V7_9CAUD|nr:gp089 [Rhodococcus phage ReqiPoco6]ADD81087.1 gp089 [Rhodococcus phage ReqiPoco6]